METTSNTSVKAITSSSSSKPKSGRRKRGRPRLNKPRTSYLEASLVKNGRKIGRTIGRPRKNLSPSLPVVNQDKLPQIVLKDILKPCPDKHRGVDDRRIQIVKLPQSPPSSSSSFPESSQKYKIILNFNKPDYETLEWVEEKVLILASGWMGNGQNFEFLDCVISKEDNLQNAKPNQKPNASSSSSTQPVPGSSKQNSKITLEPEPEMMERDDGDDEEVEDDEEEDLFTSVRIGREKEPTKDGDTPVPVDSAAETLKTDQEQEQLHDFFQNNQGFLELRTGDNEEENEDVLDIPATDPISTDISPESSFIIPLLPSTPPYRCLETATSLPESKSLCSNTSITKIEHREDQQESQDFIGPEINTQPCTVLSPSLNQSDTRPEESLLKQGRETEETEADEEPEAQSRKINEELDSSQCESSYSIGDMERDETTEDEDDNDKEVKSINIKSERLLPCSTLSENIEESPSAAAQLEMDNDKVAATSQLSSSSTEKLVPIVCEENNGDKDETADGNLEQEKTDTPVAISIAEGEPPPSSTSPIHRIPSPEVITLPSSPETVMEVEKSPSPARPRTRSITGTKINKQNPVPPGLPTSSNQIIKPGHLNKFFLKLGTKAGLKSTKRNAWNSHNHRLHLNHLILQPLVKSQNKPLQCPTCFKTFKWRQHLRRHQLSHEQEMPFKCSVCSKGYYRRDTLKRHEWSHIFVKPSQKPSATGEASVTATNSNPPTPDYPDPSSLIETAYSSDEEEEAADSPNAGGLTEKESCAATYESNLEPKPSTSASNIESSISELLVPLSSEPVKPQLQSKQCHFCYKVFAQPYRLRRHLTIHTGEKNYQCQICLERFSRNDRLKEHIRKVHINGKSPNSTAQRPASAPTQSLQNSQRKRKSVAKTENKVQSVVQGGDEKNNQRNFKCTTCSKAFPTNFRLERHVRTHSGRKPYLCTICLKRFTQNYVLKRHVINVHRVEF